MKKAFIFFAVVFISGFCQSQVKLPSLFSDNMILQQQSEAAIWGWSENENKITIVPSWDNKVYEVKPDNSKKWKTKISTPKAGGPYEIKISDGKEIIIKNVLIGEVWLCSGQSNMEMPMKGYKGQPVLGSNEAILKSKNSNIRFITVPRGKTVEMQNDFKGFWLEAEPKTVAEFSATAYFYARLLNEILNVPIGLIHVSYGGSCIETWMSKETTQPYQGKRIPQQGDSLKDPNRTPTVLFNSMLNPVIGYGIKGAIWYQGETNYVNADDYSRLFPAMVKEWRSLWELGNFPFYFAQIAPFNYKIYKPDVAYQEKYNSAYLREAQLKSLDTITNSGMAVLLDIGEEYCIHPSDKKTGGDRLAYLALNKTYGIEGIGADCPVYKAMEIKDSLAILSFDKIPNGLTSFGKEITSFEIAGSDKVFYPAKAQLKSKSVIVSSPMVKEPIAVRYAFKDFVIGELFSTEGIPVSSFRTDNW